MPVVGFVYHSGLAGKVFSAARLLGNWDAFGNVASTWTEVAMQPQTDDEGCGSFFARVEFPSARAGTAYRWGVVVDGPAGAGVWAVPTEVADPNAADRYRSFRLTRDEGEVQEYWLSTSRRFGAQKHFAPDTSVPGIRFSVWAPNARAVDVVFAPADGPLTGYIDDRGGGIDPRAPVVALTRGTDGRWTSDPANPALRTFADFVGRQYLFRVINEQGDVTYKTDLWSRNQIGRGSFNPRGRPYAGPCADLDGTVSASVVSDPDLVTADFDDTGLHKSSLQPAADFWRDEFDAQTPLPARIEDLVIYELHVGSLGARNVAGSFADALAFLDSLVDLGVNAVELLPVIQFNGDREWGYGSSHFFCIQTSAGGANQFKHFVRACHRRGIAVIMDVVYSHFLTEDGERSEWGYDSDPARAPQHNSYYWYEGLPSAYASLEGGYVDNDSSGWAPRWWEEHVRAMFSASALMLVDEYHVDGLRVDLTDAVHQNNRLHADGRIVGAANAFGTKFLRELTRSVRLVRPGAFLIAEDHTQWPAMVERSDAGGIGFDAVWYADFYHHLIGDGSYDRTFARLLYVAGLGGGEPLAMDYLAGALTATQYGKIVYHECHDTAGNEAFTDRTLVTAVHAAPLVGETRRFAEARARVCCGLSMLSAGTPMFLMGEEIGAVNPFRYTDFYKFKEDLIGERSRTGRYLFRFYQELIALVRANPCLRSRVLDIAYVHNANRVIAFQRRAGDAEALVVASFNDRAFPHGYAFATPSAASGSWQETFNSDAARYGGNGVGNAGATIVTAGGSTSAVLPACGFIVLERVG